MPASGNSKGDHMRASAQATCRDDFTLSDPEAHYPPDLHLEPVHTDLDLKVDIREESLEGTVIHTIRARGTGFRSVTFHAVDFESITVADPGGNVLTHRYDGSELRVTWEEEFAGDEERRVAISYMIVKPVTGLFFSRPSDAYPDRAQYAATDSESERARHWFPCIDHPTIRPTLEFHIRAEKDLTILANGARGGEDLHGDGTKTVHWKLDHPCPAYLTCFAIGEFVTAEDGEFAGMPLATFATKEFTPEHLRRSFGRTRAMLEWMTKKLDRPFPTPKYFQFALPTFGGAMENISLVSWDDIFILDETLAKEWAWLIDQINVHEMAHSYFGDSVVVRDFAHVWLKESWATYMETCWLEHHRGEDEMLYDLYSNAQAYFEEADEKYHRPIVTRKFDSSWTMYDRHLYPGGGIRLHMLRKTIGDEAFWSGVRDYVKKYERKVVETSDFRRVLEERSGKSLVRFFDQWFHTAGYPELKATFSHDSEKGEGIFEIEQKQAEGKKGIPVFDMPLEIGWVSRGMSHTRVVRLNRARKSFRFAMEEPEQVRIDPDSKMVFKLEFNPGDGMLRKQLTGAPDVVGRILAGRELASTAKTRNIEAIGKAWSEEPFWGVRVRWAKALGKSATSASIDALVEIVKTEQDPMVLSSVFRACGEIRDGKIRGAVEARVKAGIDLYIAEGEALKALGAQREDAPLDLLKGAAKKGKFSGLTQSGAFHALAATRKREALGPLLDAAREGGAPIRARAAATVAIGKLARFQEKKDRENACEKLEELLLRDSSGRVNAAAARGLGALGERSALGSLETYRRRIAAQDRPALDRIMKEIREGDAPRVKGLEKELEEIRGKFRKLEERLFSLETKSGDSK